MNPSFNLKKTNNFLEHIPADMELEASYTLDRPLVHQAHRERQVRTLTSTLTGYLTPINLSKETEGNSRRHREKHANSTKSYGKR